MLHPVGVQTYMNWMQAEGLRAFSVEPGIFSIPTPVAENVHIVLKKMGEASEGASLFFITNLMRAQYFPRRQVYGAVISDIEVRDQRLQVPFGLEQ